MDTHVHTHIHTCTHARPRPGHCGPGPSTWHCETCQVCPCCLRAEPRGPVLALILLRSVSLSKALIPSSLQFLL